MYLERDTDNVDAAMRCYTMVEAGKFLCISVPTMKRLVHGGKIKGFYQGQRLMVTGRALREYCEAQELEMQDKRRALTMRLEPKQTRIGIERRWAVGGDEPKV